eukprot:scaffold4565_cov53-Cyclotella_meneghiniana.AAC.14
MQRRLHDRVRYDVIGYTLVPRMAVGMGGYGEDAFVYWWVVRMRRRHRSMDCMDVIFSAFSHPGEFEAFRALLHVTQ